MEVSGDGTSELEVRRLVGDHQQTMLVFNHSSAAADASIAVRLPWAVQQARELETDEAVLFRAEAGRTTFHKRFLAGEIWVFSVRPS